MQRQTKIVAFSRLPERDEAADTAARRRVYLCQEITPKSKRPKITYDDDHVNPLFFMCRLARVRALQQLIKYVKYTKHASFRPNFFLKK